MAQFSNPDWGSLFPLSAVSSAFNTVWQHLQQLLVSCAASFDVNFRV
jgi:hypothetical protein